MAGRQWKYAESNGTLGDFVRNTYMESGEVKRAIPTEKMKNWAIFSFIFLFFTTETTAQIRIFRYPSPLLYKNCENALAFEAVCSKTGEIGYVFEGGEIRVSDTNNQQIYLFPTQNTARLTLFESINGRNERILSIDCRVFEPPAPYMMLYQNGARQPKEDTLTVSEGDSIRIEIAADPEFAFLYPKEATYLSQNVFIQYTHKDKSLVKNKLNAVWKENQLLWVVPKNTNAVQIDLMIDDIQRINSSGQGIAVTESAYFSPFLHIVIIFRQTKSKISAKPKVKFPPNQK